MNGQGIMTWSDGRKFDGQWNDNKIKSPGTFTFSDGIKYICVLIDDSKNGLATFIHSDCFFSYIYEG